MRRFSKKLACVVASAAMVVTMVPAAQAQAAETFTLNRTSQILYVNEGASYNKQVYDFNFKTKPANYLKDYTFAWATDKPEVATVKAGGIVTAVGVGKAKISCVVSDKATGDVVTTVTADVEVKANAKTVTISNPEVADGLAFEAGNVIDLNRSMTDYQGNITNKRGQYVTDLTRWVAEPAEGIEINQKNGQFTITDKATGEYELYCETYQSSKHPEATSKSKSVKITVNNNMSFDVKQTTATTFTVNFDKVVKTLNLEDVTLTRLFETADETYEFPQVVSKAELAKDGKSATVTVFSALADKVKYNVKITGFETYTMTASVGAPASMTLSAAADKITPFVTANKDTKICYKLYDANGVDVTAEGQTILFNVKEYSTDGSYYVAGDQIWFAKAGVTTTVTAEYQSGVFKDGVQVGNVAASFDFTSVDVEPVTFKGLSGATIMVGDTDTKSMSVPMDVDANLVVFVKKSDANDPIKVTTDGQVIDGIGTITFQEISQDKLALDKTDLSLVKYKEGVSQIVVNLVTKDSNGNDVTTPVGIATITVTAARALSTVALDKTLVTVGNTASSATASIKVSGKDQYGNNSAITSVVVEGANDAAKAVVTNNEITVSGDTINIVTGDKLLEACGKSNAAQLSFKAKINGSKEVTFSVLVKKVGDDKLNYISLEKSGEFGDVARKDGDAAAKAAKSVTVNVYQMNNGVKNKTQEVAKYPASTDGVKQGEYYVKVTKDGKDVTANDLVVVSGSAVTINFSTTKAADKVTGSVVDYALGAGNYSVILYYAQKDKVLVQQQAINGVATCNTGAYSAATRIKESIAAAEVGQAGIRACFDIKNTAGKDATAAYYVDYNNDATDYVYVNSITFYDEVESGVYAAYTVKIEKTLKKN